jgi:hypothetical protein
MHLVSSGLLLAVALAAIVRADQPRPAPLPRGAVTAIAEVFKTHDVVTLPHGHTRQAHEFLRALIAAPGVGDAIDDLVVEFGNARYQDLVDRYVRGDDITLAQIQPAWQNAVAPNTIWADEQLFEIVRAQNRTRSKDRQLRILLGDSPIDWSTVEARADHFPWLAMRDSFPAALIQTQVLARRRKALVVYGSMHFQRRQIMSNYDMSDWRTQTIVSLIERSTPARVFTIWGIDEDLLGVAPELATWQAPAVAVPRGTALGAADFAVLVPDRPRMTLKGNALVPLPREQWTTLPLEDQVDAVLYLGPKSAMIDAEVPARACAAPGFLEERLRRIAVAGIPPFEADRLQKICGRKPAQ